MNRGKRLLYLINDIPFFLSHRLQLAQAALRAGFEIHVGGPDDQGEGLLAPYGFRFYPLPMTRGKVSPIQEVRAFLRITRLLASLKPDLLHAITFRPVVYGGAAAFLRGNSRCIFSFTGLGHSFSQSGLRASFARAVIFTASRFAMRHKMSRTIFQNPDDLNEFVGAGVVRKKKCVLIRGSGVNLDSFKPRSESEGDPPLVILASRLLWEKGIQEFVEAARRLKAEGVQATFALVGKPDLANPSAIQMETINQWENDRVIQWWGYRKDMNDVFAQCSLVCLPSYYREGVPKVLLEAAASGRPIITTDSPGCREIVRNGVNGLLVPPRDVDSLVVAMRKLLADPRLRMAMGKKGREIVAKEFSEDIVISSTLAVYREVLSLDRNRNSGMASDSGVDPGEGTPPRRFVGPGN